MAKILKKTMMKKIMMKINKLFRQTLLIGFVSVLFLAGCAVNSEPTPSADPEDPQVVAEAIVDTKHEQTLPRTGMRYYVNVRPHLDSPIEHSWQVSKTTYNMCWHGDIARSYDNGVVVCFDNDEDSNGPSDNGGEAN